MKQFIIGCLLSIIGLLVYEPYPLAAQTLPIDTQVRIGKLPNGLTYYIRHNEEPKGHADFQIFHAVGALQEEDNQNGLAHFLEHQAFKGLAHFPGKSMLDYMETIGVKFGRNLNASTTTDYTRYMINQVPISRPGIIDTCLLVLYDWSGSILATQADIDSERGVIAEERRMRGGAKLRIQEALTPYYFKNSKYVKRNVIGDVAVIDTFKRPELMDFYHKWYRPDLQAIAIVGDFNVDTMEASVKRLFSTLPSTPKKERIAKTHYPLPDNVQPIYGTYSDPEVSTSSINLLFKHPKPSAAARQTVRTYADRYIRNLILSMMNNRWDEISYKQDWPLKDLHYSFGTLASDRDVFGISGDIKPNQESLVPALAQMLSESERFRRHGFTPTELDLAKADYKRRLDRSYIDRDKRSNGTFVNRYFNHFINDAPVLSIETSNHLLHQVLDTLSLPYVNAGVKELFTRENRIITVTTPLADSSAIPTKATILAQWDAIEKKEISPYADTGKPTLEPSHPPIPGKIIAEQEGPFGATLWTLSNGIKVYILPTEHKNDEILMTAYSPGGHSTLKDEDYLSSRMVTTAIQTSGVGNVNAVQLSSALSGKIVYVTPFLSELSESFDGSTTPSDYESMLKLVYMYFTEPRFDKEAFDLKLQEIKGNLKARKANPFSAIQDTVIRVRSNYHFRASNIILDPEDIDQVDFNRIQELYKMAFGNPTDFTFMFTGAIDPATARPVIEKYIGGLTGPHREDQWQDVGKRSPKGVKTIDFTRKMETPKAITFIEYTRETPYSYRKVTAMRLLQGILEIRFNTLLRNEQSGTYSTSVEASVQDEPYGKLRLIVSFETDPKLMDQLTPIVHNELQRLAKEGVSKENLEKSREFMEKSRIQSLTNNRYWEHILYTYVTKDGRDIYTDSERILSEIDIAEVTALLQALVEANNVVTVTMRPE